MPRPRMVTSSTSSDSVPANWKVPFGELDHLARLGGEERGLRAFLQVLARLDHGDLGPRLDGGLARAQAAGKRRARTEHLRRRPLCASIVSLVQVSAALLRAEIALLHSGPSPAILRRPLGPASGASVPFSLCFCSIGPVAASFGDRRPVVRPPRARAPERRRGGTRRVLHPRRRRARDRAGAARRASPQGVTIGDVDVRVLDVFEPSTDGDDPLVHRIANRLHVNTRPRVVERELLFESGDPYDARAIDESERRLRAARRDLRRLRRAGARARRRGRRRGDHARRVDPERGRGRVAIGRGQHHPLRARGRQLPRQRPPARPPVHRRSRPHRAALPLPGSRAAGHAAPSSR